MASNAVECHVLIVNKQSDITKVYFCVWLVSIINHPNFVFYSFSNFKNYIKMIDSLIQK